MYHSRHSHVKPLAGTFLALSLLAGTAEAKPRIYVEIRGVKLQAASTKCGLDVKTMRAEFKKTLAARPEVTMSLGQRLEGVALAKALKARGLAGYGVVLRVTRCGYELHPPTKGKRYKVLMAEVAAAIDAEKIPSGQLALAGEGSSQVGTEVTRVKDKERIQLQGEALVTATKQAVDRAVSSLTTKRKKSRRRSRRRR